MHGGGCLPPSPQLLVLGSWVGARRLFQLSLFLAAPRMALPQDPGTDPCALRALRQAGCIIRARFLDRIKAAYDKNPELESLLIDPEFTKEILEGQVRICAHDRGDREIGRALRPAPPATGTAAARGRAGQGRAGWPRPTSS